MKQFTSKIDFKITGKRLKMMSSKLSIWRAFPKIVFTASMLTVLALISCTETEEWPGHMTWQQVHDKVPPTTYKDVELKSEGVTGLYHPLDERTGLLIGPNGEPYTGEQNTYHVETDLVISKETIINGKVTRREFPSYDSTGAYQYKSVVIPSLDENGNKVTTYYSDRTTDSLILNFETIVESELQTHNFYYPDGQIQMSASYKWDPTKKDLLKHGLITEYDEENNIIQQERYQDGKLIEKIK